MKYQTVVSWCAVSDLMIITVSEVAEYEFNYRATQDALDLMQELRYKTAAEGGCGWQLLYNAGRYLERDCEKYFKGQ